MTDILRIRTILPVGLLLTCLLTFPVCAETIGYTIIKPEAKPDQRNLMSVVVTMRFPHAVQTVGQAITMLLENSGYRLAAGVGVDPHQRILLSLPLPLVDRMLGPITLRDALITLAGPSWVLVEDPVNRLISYDLNVPTKTKPELADERSK